MKLTSDAEFRTRVTRNTHNLLLNLFQPSSLWLDLMHVIPPTVMVGGMMCLESNGVVKDHLLKHPQLRLPRNFNS